MQWLWMAIKVIHGRSRCNEIYYFYLTASMLLIFQRFVLFYIFCVHKFHILSFSVALLGTKRQCFNTHHVNKHIFQSILHFLFCHWCSVGVLVSSLQAGYLHQWILTYTTCCSLALEACSMQKSWRNKKSRWTTVTFYTPHSCFLPLVDNGF